MLDSDVLLTVALILLAISSVLNFIGRTSGKNDDKNDVTDFDTYINWLDMMVFHTQSTKKCVMMLAIKLMTLQLCQSVLTIMSYLTMMVQE